MNYVELLIEVNKISIIFFFITLLFLVYEFYLFKKEKSGKVPLKLPQLDFFLKNPRKITQDIKPGDEKPHQHKQQKKLIWLSIIFLVIFGVIAILGYLLSVKKEPEFTTRTTAAPVTITPTPTLLPTPTVFPTQQPTLTAQTEEPTPTEILLAEQISPTIESSPTSIPDTEALPAAGNTQFQTLIFVVAAVVLFISFVF